MPAAPRISSSPASRFRESATGLVGLLVSLPAAAFTLVIPSSDFVVTPVFSDGTGTIQNSNNVPTQGVEVDFGEEYITNLAFDPGNLTIVEAPLAIGPSGSSAVSPLMSAVLLLAGLWRRRLRAVPT